MEHKVGDKMFVDYTGKKLSIIDRNTGEIQAVEVFASTLESGSASYTNDELIAFLIDSGFDDKENRKVERIVLLFDYNALRYKFKHGYPLTELIYQKEHLLYQKEGIDFDKLTTRGFKEFNNQYNIYKERYYQDHDLLTS